jgi:hypothetical protein
MSESTHINETIIFKKSRVISIFPLLIHYLKHDPYQKYVKFYVLNDRPNP